jgi:hypothetical protein
MSSFYTEERMTRIPRRALYDIYINLNRQYCVWGGRSTVTLGPSASRYFLVEAIMLRQQQVHDRVMKCLQKAIKSVL